MTPRPPLELANRVCALQDGEDPYAEYETRGAEARAAIVGLLPDDWTWTGKRALDFGCGAGRTLRHFLDEDAELHGSDIDGPSVAWLREHLSPPLHIVQNGVAPPLDSEPGTFDLIWSLSVFTHLVEDLSAPWLLELHRLLKPGGYLIATYMGRLNGEVFSHEPWDEDRVGMNVLRRNQGWDDGGPSVLMSDWWVAEHWGRAFEIVATTPVHGQSWVLLRRREVTLTPDELMTPGDDPREYVALRHNLVQVERDHAHAVGELRSARTYRLAESMRKAAHAAKRLRR